MGSILDLRGHLQLYYVWPHNRATPHLEKFSQSQVSNTVTLVTSAEQIGQGEANAGNFGQLKQRTLLGFFVQVDSYWCLLTSEMPLDCHPYSYLSTLPFPARPECRKRLRDVGIPRWAEQQPDRFLA